MPRIAVADETRTRTRGAPQWKVLFHNDDVTTMDFVVAVLVRFYGHNLQDAQGIMLAIHTTGIGLAGVYAFEQAEFKRDQTVSAARPHYPLRVTLEPA